MIILNYDNEKIEVHEYKDAKRIIKKISKENYDNFTKIAKGGKYRNIVAYANFANSFDIETTTIKPGQLNYEYDKDSPPIAFPYLFQFCFFGKVIICRKYEECINIFNWISESLNLGEKRKCIFFIHNLSYEFHFFKDLWDIEAKGSFCMDERHPITVYTKDGFIFRDSYKMTNMSLEILSKDYSKKYYKLKEIMDYSKLRTPYSELDNNTLLYSVLDVLSLSDSIFEFLKSRGENVWTRCPTSTSFIRKDLKKVIGIGVKKRTPEQKKYFKILEKQKINKDIYELIKRVGRGGNTHANRFYTGKLFKNVYHGDIISCYPAQMVCMPEFPLGTWQKLDEGMSIDDVMLFEKNGYCTMFDLILINAEIKEDITVPYISISKMLIIKGSNMRASDNGRYLGGIEAIRISIFGCELPIILRQYDFSDAFIIKGYYTHKGYMPDIIRKFVLNLYEKKTKLKGVEGSEIEYTLAKTYVNGVFGMAYTDPVRISYELNEEGNIIECETPNIDEFLVKYQRSISYFMPYVWGAMAAALGRLQLQSMIEAAGDNFIYCDTDSIFAIDDWEMRHYIDVLNMKIKIKNSECGLKTSYENIRGIKQELMLIDEEKKCEYFKTFGAKKYITVEDGKLTCTIAGVPKKKGAEVIGTPENFQLGLNFPGAITGKSCLWYNEAPNFELKDDKGRKIEIYSNVAMLPCDYLLNMSKEYQECLSIEGNFHWLFKDAEKNVINEGDF